MDQCVGSSPALPPGFYAETQFARGSISVPLGPTNANATPRCFSEIPVLRSSKLLNSAWRPWRRFRSILLRSRGRFDHQLENLSSLACLKFGTPHRCAHADPEHLYLRQKASLVDVQMGDNKAARLIETLMCKVQKTTAQSIRAMQRESSPCHVFLMFQTHREVRSVDAEMMRVIRVHVKPNSFATVVPENCPHKLLARH